MEHAFEETLGAGEWTFFVLKLDSQTAGQFSGEVSFTSDDPDENPFSFYITGEVLPDPTLTIDLDADDSSHALGSGYVTHFAEGTPANIADVDADIASQLDTLDWMKVTITDLADAANESLALSWSGPPAGYALQHTYDQNTGELTFTGQASLAVYEMALRAVTYEHAQPGASDNHRKIEVSAGDSQRTSNLAETLVMFQRDDLPDPVPPAQIIPWQPNTPNFDHEPLPIRFWGGRLLWPDFVGIRRNGDDDDGDRVRDFDDPLIAEPVPGAEVVDNDLLLADIRLSGTIGEYEALGFEVWLARGPGIAVHADTSKKSPILAKDAPPAVRIIGAETRRFPVYLEWNTEAIGVTESFLELQARSPTLTVLLATIYLKPFKSVVIGFVGEGQEVTKNTGLKDILKKLRREGYDAHVFDEDDVGDDRDFAANYLLKKLWGGEWALGHAPWRSSEEVGSAIFLRGVSEVGIIGYSHGAGAAYMLSRRMQTLWGADDRWHIAFTAYIDGVKKGSVYAQVDIPLEADERHYHMNYYQSRVGIDGFLAEEHVPVQGAFNPDGDYNDDVDKDDPWLEAGDLIFGGEAGLMHTNLRGRGIAENLVVQSSIIRTLKLKLSR